MNANVIEFGELRIRREGRDPFSRTKCPHTHIVFDDNGGTVECEDCKKQLDLYFVLGLLTRQYDRAWSKVNSERGALQEAAAKTVELRAAQRVEKAWRSRTMVPTCPHCRAAIFPQDGFGGSATNKEMALRRRKVAAEANSAIVGVLGVIETKENDRG